MRSNALEYWRTERIAALDQLERAHRSIEGSSGGRRFATQQINHSYAVLLSSQFQGFCRDLHTECAEAIVEGITPALRKTICLAALLESRKLDRGNPNPGNLGSDFNRFGLRFWGMVKGLDTRNQGRQNQLEELNEWRNAIAHQDFDSAAFAGAVLHVRRVRDWRRVCHLLAESFDEVMRQHILLMHGAAPW